MATRKQGSSQVVVITDHRDAHLTFVERHLNAKPVVIDPLDLVSDKKLTLTIQDGKIVVIYDGQPLEKVSGVWFRKPQAIPSDLPVPKEYQQYSRWAIQRLAEALYVAFADATWVSDYYRIVRAENKPLQLAIAQQLGMHVPETIFTSDRSAVAKFLKDHPKSITKPLTNSFPTSGNKAKLFFTTRIGGDFVPDLTNLQLAPAIFQDAVNVVFDVRVTVVDNAVFVASAQPKEAYALSRIQDFRLGHYEGGVIIKPFADFPTELAQRSVQLTKELGLRFGALDFVLDDQGKYWFLECNPNGQWAFIERDTHHPIGKALAGLLQGAD